MEIGKLYIFCGLPFSGKTTFAKKLAEKKHWVRVDIDEIKGEHGFGSISDDEITHEEWVSIFNDMNNRIRTYLKEGKTVISDISNLEKSDRDDLRKIAEEVGSTTRVVYINTPVEVARQRWLRNRETNSRFDLTENVIGEAINSLQVPTTEENVIILDYMETREDWMKLFSDVV